jgi:hypothetical protein
MWPMPRVMGSLALGVFDMNNIEIDEEQLILLMYHASHGIMQLQIQ